MKYSSHSLDEGSLFYSFKSIYNRITPDTSLWMLPEWSGIVRVMTREKYVSMFSCPGVHFNILTNKWDHGGLLGRKKLFIGVRWNYNYLRIVKQVARRTRVIYPTFYIYVVDRKLDKKMRASSFGFPFGRWFLFCIPLWMTTMPPMHWLGGQVNEKSFLLPIYTHHNKNIHYSDIEWYYKNRRYLLFSWWVCISEYPGTK